ncbi:MAG: type II secretion system protein [Lachnospiraceae bacterium]
MKKNNKGFSLVELIIVIAIMAVLIGILAPQYLKFVERSKKSTDCQNVDAIVSALEVYSVDTSVASGDVLASSGKITLTTTSTAVGTTNATGNADKALAAAGIDTLQLKSTKWSETTIEINFSIDANGNVTVTCTDSNILTGTY